MSAILDSRPDPERRAACVLHDVEMLAWAKKQAARLATVSYDRKRPFVADCIDTVDAVLDGIEAGAARVEVIPCATHDLQVQRAAATAECSTKDGYPTGWHSVSEDLSCSCCGTWRTRAVDGTRAQSAGAAMALYRAGAMS